MSSTNNNNNPIGQMAPSSRSDEMTDLIIDNMLKRTHTNHFLLMAYMEEMRNNQMDIANLLRLNPSPEVRQSNLAKLAAINYSTETINAQFVPQINSVPVQHTITGAATVAVESITATANNVNEQPKVPITSTSSTLQVPEKSTTSLFVNSTRKYGKKIRFTVRKLECTEEQCNERFESMSKLEEHLASRIHKIALHRCPQMGCKLSFDSKSQLIDHKNQKHSCTAYQCKVCHRRFNQIGTSKDRFESLLKHYKENHYHGVYVCTICQYETNTQVQAKAHYDKCCKLSTVRPPAKVSNSSSTPYQTLPDPYRFASPSPAPINFSLNSTTINNTYNQQLQSRTPKPPVANKLLLHSDTKVVKQTPIDLTKQKQQTSTTNPSPSRPVRKSVAIKVVTMPAPINLAEQKRSILSTQETTRLQGYMTGTRVRKDASVGSNSGRIPRNRV